VSKKQPVTHLALTIPNYQLTLKLATKFIFSSAIQLSNVGNVQLSPLKMPT